MKAKKPTTKKAGATHKSATKSKVASKHRLQIEVLQNGASLLSVSLPLKRRGHLALTSKGRGPFVLPHYPLSDGHLDFLRFVPGGIELDVDHGWEGFCTSNGDLVTLKRQSRGRHKVMMQRGDYASITENDLRIMIKLAPPALSPANSRSGTNPAYRKSLLSLAFTSKLEIQMGLVGLAITTILIGSAAFGLLKRPFHRATRLADVAPAYALPFIAPEHLSTAPEALQEHLDRRQWIDSVLAYYLSLTAALMGRPEANSKWLDSSTLDLYQGLFAEVRKKLDTKIELQHEVDHLQAMKDGVATLSIPSVLGESSSGSMLRIIDKINIMQHGMQLNLAAKRDIMLTFPADPEYSWDEYRDVKRPDTTAMTAAVRKIRAFSNMSDEEMMYAEADALAKKARRIQHTANSAGHQGDGQRPSYQEPIAMPEGVRYATFATGQDLRLADEKLYQIQASEYGSLPQGEPKVREPLIGQLEPPLIERYIKENRFQLQLCYELALRRNEQAAGTMEWKWRIDSRGAIADVALIISSIQDPRMTECIRQKIMTWRFPRPRHGSVEVSFPFEFAPTKG